MDKNNPPFSHVIKRDGSKKPFTKIRITNAIYRAAIATGGRELKIAEELSEQVIKTLKEKVQPGKYPSVEQIQDTIEKILMENEFTETAKAFILYRNERKRNRSSKKLSGNYKTRDLIPWKKVWYSLNWSIDHNLLTVKDLNKKINSGNFNELVRDCEKAYKLDIIRGADTILNKSGKIKLVIIAGPSASGKTTTTKNIARYLESEGFKFVPFHVDNYFRDIEFHPKDENGDYDYEIPAALDMELLNKHLKELCRGREIVPPAYNFKTGKREGKGEPVSLDKGELLLIDSHHGLYEDMTRGISNNRKVKIYVEPLLQMRGMDGAYYRWTDLRLIRRMLRDRRERGVKPIDTLTHWKYVRQSELQYIMPHISSAEYVINSSLPYELSIWKKKIGHIFKGWVKEGKEKFKNFETAYNRAIRVNNMLKDIAEP
ncbi:MAG: ATP cone domain-containing protein, partial [Elusimicrobiota bacterium]